MNEGRLPTTYGPTAFFSAADDRPLLGSAVLTIMTPAHLFPPFGPLGLLGAVALMAGSQYLAFAGIVAAGLGFANIWPMLFSITVEEKPECANELSGLMCMAISGGAIVPLVMGQLMDLDLQGTWPSSSPPPASPICWLLSLQGGRAPAKATKHLPRKPHHATQRRFAHRDDPGRRRHEPEVLRHSRQPTAVRSDPHPHRGRQPRRAAWPISSRASRRSAPAAPRRRWRSASPFPGPVDYPAGIVGDLGNLPGFRGGVALGPMLEERFGLPMFINNDGDLFTYGEAISGFLPYVNERLKAAGSAKQYKNLFGITLGTGFGGGIARNGELFIGDNAAAAEIWVMRGKLHNRCFVEEDVSIRAVQRVYAEHSKVKHAETPTPKDIYDFATGSGQGDQQAAILAFSTLGEAIGDALANAMTLIDGLVVIGGGLSAAAPLFLPRLVAEMNGTIETLDGRQIPRMELKAFNLEDEAVVRRLRPRRGTPHHRARQQPAS